MQKTTAENLAALYANLKKMKFYEHALKIMNFDFETSVPLDSREDEGNVISFFSNEHFKLATSKKMKELTVALHESVDELDEKDKVLVESMYRDYLKVKNVTPKTQMRWSQMFNKAYIDWYNAKNASDFSLFKDSLANVIEISKEDVALRENALPDLYDNLLDDCEEGVLTADLDAFFAELKSGLIELIGKIKNSSHVIREDFLSRKVPIYKQERFSRYLLELNGYDFNKGYLTTTEHPFTMDVAENDARVTTHYYEDMVLSNIYSVIHEGGHAIFMQNQPAEDYDHFINDRITNGMHESVSRFYENVIGRSEEYIRLIYPKFRELFADELGDVSERELYEAVNIVKPSLIRTEADEVTYGLHIVIRYEMEKLICSGKIAVEDIPKKWNELYTEYLGVTPQSDKEGVLQDVHWTSGFGYFPSYALGNAYNAAYLKEIKKDMDLGKAILGGDLAAIKTWLKEHVFKNSNTKKPKEWLKDLTGKTLSAKDFLEYLNEKYSEIYRLN
ncbi:MAG: carboxypeptidase M32 [Clostridia bacterium]|nr:carboxypeptidase M32 [Clostridia bacterium]